MKNLFYALIVVIANTVVINAQTIPADRVVISGHVVDSISGQAISYATISVEPVGLKTKAPFGQVSDHNGYFRIELPRASSYMVRTSFVGMKGSAQTFNLSPSSSNLDVGKLLMQPDANLLAEIKVVRQAPLVKFSLDRIAYAIQEDKDSQTKTLLEMLRKVPLVTVDGQGNIQVKGSSSFRVFLNGKPSPMFDQDPQNILRSIPASTIKRVEVITEPGVKYSAEGVGAIINIVTATAAGDGITGTVRLAGGLPASSSGGLYLAMKQGKFGATLNTNGYYFEGDGSQTSDTEYNDGLTISNRANGTRRGGGGYGNLLLSYELDSLNLLTVTGSFRPYSQRQTDHAIIERYRSGLLTDRTKYRNETTGLFGNWEGGLDYQRSTKRAGELLTLSYKYSYNPYNKSLDRTTVEGVTAGQAERTRTVSGLGEHTAQVDYVRPFTQAHNLEVGAKYIYRGSEATPTYEKYNLSTGQWETGSNFASELSQSHFLHTYNIWAGYAAYNYRHMRYSLKAGVRVEGGNMAVKYEKVPKANFSDTFLNWVPELTLEYKPTDTQQLKLNYNFRIQRPSISQLNPYALRESPYVIQQGNPDLKAEKKHRINLDYNLYTSRFMLTTSVGFGFVNNKIQSFSRTEGDIIHTTGRNIGRGYGTSLSTYVNWSPTLWLRLYNMANLEYSINTAPVLGLTVRGLSVYIGGGGQITLPKSWTIDTNIGYYKQGRGLQTSGGSDFSHSYGVTKSLLQDRLSIGIALQDPFRKNKSWASRVHGQGFISQSALTYPARSVSLRVSYRFGSLKQQVRRTERTIVNDDLIKGDTNQQGGGGQGGK